MENTDFYIVGLGASAGGHQALWDFFSAIPPDLGVAFVVVQHLYRERKSVADKLIAKHTSLPVYRAQNYQLVNPNGVYVLPEDKMMTIHNRVLRLRNRRPDEVINMAVNIFFHSLADDLKENAVGIIFSGLGTDGASGVKAIHEQGGLVMVQDPKSAQFDGMPKTAIRADSPDYVSPPAEMAYTLAQHVRSSVPQNKR